MSVPAAIAPHLPGGRPPAPPGGRRPRHAHSPRVRRLARERGLSPDDVAGTGPLGRVTRDDVLRAGSDPESHSPPGPAASPTLRSSVCEVEVTRLARTTDLLACVVESAVQALRAVRGPRSSAPSARVLVGATSGTSGRPGRPGRDVVNADDLSVAGIRRALEDASVPADPEGTSVGPALTVDDLGGSGMLFDLPVLGHGAVAALSVGDVVDRPAVVPLPDGGRGIGMATFVHVALTVDEQAVGADAVSLLAQVRRRLEAHEGRSS